MQFYWGTDEVLIPVYQTMKEAFEKHKDVTVVVNFSSFRSVFSTVDEMLQYSSQIKTIAIIAEGVPEAQTRLLNKKAHSKGVGIIGPATVGGIKVSQDGKSSLKPQTLTTSTSVSLDASESEIRVECLTISSCPSCTVQVRSAMYRKVAE